MEPEWTTEKVAELPKEPEAPAPEDAPALDFDAGAAELVLGLLATDGHAVAAAEARLPAAHRAYVASPAFAQEVAWRMRSLANGAAAGGGDDRAHHASNGDAAAAPFASVRFAACVPSVRGLFGDASGSRAGNDEALNARLVAFVQAFDASGSGALEAPEFALFLRWFYAVAFAEEASEGAEPPASAPSGDAADSPPQRQGLPQRLFEPLPATQLDPSPLPGDAEAAVAPPTEQLGVSSSVLSMAHAVAGEGL
jgi:hypothetical protein